MEMGCWRAYHADKRSLISQRTFLVRLTMLVTLRKKSRRLGTLWYCSAGTEVLVPLTRAEHTFPASPPLEVVVLLG